MTDSLDRELDKIFFQFHREADKAWQLKNYKTELPKIQNIAKSKLKSLLAKRERKARIDEIGRYENAIQTLSEDALYTYADTRLSELTRLEEEDD